MVDTKLHGRVGKCKQSCCRTPFGVCAHKGNCDCHRNPLSDDALTRLLEEASAEESIKQAEIRRQKSMESEWYKKHRENPS